MLCITGAQPPRTGDSPEEGVTSHGPPGHRGVAHCTQNVLFQRLDGLSAIIFSPRPVLFPFFFLNMGFCLHVCLCEGCEGVDPLESELHTDVSHCVRAGIEPGSSRRAASVLNC